MVTCCASVSVCPSPNTIIFAAKYKESGGPREQKQGRYSISHGVPELKAAEIERTLSEDDLTGSDRLP